MLRVGMGRVDVTPPVGTLLAGYPTRHDPSDRLHDPLFVRSVAISSGPTLMCMVSLDVMAVDAAFVAELRRRALERHGIAPDHLMVSATHTHSSMGGLLSYSGPTGRRMHTMFGEGAGAFKADRAAWLLEHALQSVDAAVGGMRPAEVGLARTRASGIASNRIHGDTVADDSVEIVVFRALEGGTIGALLHFTCHPTTLGASDLGISADFPGVACAALERHLGPGTVVGFLNGALGDISTRYTRSGFGPDEVHRFARILSDAAGEAIGSIDSWESEVELSGKETTVLLPARRPVEADAEAVPRIQAELEKAGAAISSARRRELEIALQGAMLAESWRRQTLGEPEPVNLTLQRLSLAPLVHFIGVPGEPFSRIGAQIAAHSASAPVLVVAPANGYLGYLPDDVSFGSAPYESNATLIEQGAEGLLVESAAALLSGVDRTNTQNPKSE
jgi:hypothetical protein